jgi:hypothetical protein
LHIDSNSRRYSAKFDNKNQLCTSAVDPDP